MGRAKLFAYDWDEDGLLELLIGTHSKIRPTNASLYEKAEKNAGGATVMLIDNVGTPEKPIWGQIYAVVQKGGQPLDYGRHGCAPIMVDRNKDGRHTMLVGTEDGFFYRFEKDELELSEDIIPPLADAAAESVYPSNGI